MFLRAFKCGQWTQSWNLIVKPCICNAGSLNLMPLWIAILFCIPKIFGSNLNKLITYPGELGVFLSSSSKCPSSVLKKDLIAFSRILPNPILEHPFIPLSTNNVNEAVS
jgi:hypothetical protein